MTNIMQQGDTEIRSNKSANPSGKKGPAKLGQNGFGGASSDTPGKRTTSGLLPELDALGKVDAIKARTQANVQTREVSAEQYPAAHGHRNVNASPVKVPPNGRPVKR